MINSRQRLQQRSTKIFFCVSILLLFLLISGCNFPLTFNDSAGNRITLLKQPTRIISLVPSVTEIIDALGADSLLVGVTHYSRKPAQLDRCQIVGGFLKPSLSRIQHLNPDLIFISLMQKSLRPKLEKMGCQVVEVETSSLADSYDDIELIGRIVGQPDRARELVAKTRQTLQFISRKIDKIPVTERRRVLRMMGHKKIIAPGGDSFQNEIITAAGGILPEGLDEGAAVVMDTSKILAFNPQFIYACGNRHEVWKVFRQPEFSDVAAVQSGSIYFFPCALTCRAATHVGEFVEWLAASIYPDFFSCYDNMILPEKVSRRKKLTLDLDCVKKAEVVEMTLADFHHRTLVVDLVEPMRVLSTLEGFRQGITCVGNHYLPPPTWNLVHRIGVDKFDARIENLINRQPETTALLFTGADMKNLVQKTASFKEMKVVALVTAGVCSNALRMSVDKGNYYELSKPVKDEKPGTINILILTNTRLTSRSMSRALISVCEAKTAALQDLDIRSSVKPAFSQATGTGTDNIIVVEGRGRTVSNAGGHSKMGELIAKAVHDGVIEAIKRQNRIYKGRSIFHRLRERRIEIYDFVDNCKTGFSEDNYNNWQAQVELTGKVEQLLLENRYASFLEDSLALSDAYLRGQVKELDEFRNQCTDIAEEIAGHSLNEPAAVLYKGPELPLPLQLALEALVRGARVQVKPVALPLSDS